MDCFSLRALQKCLSISITLINHKHQLLASFTNKYKKNKDKKYINVVHIKRGIGYLQIALGILLIMAVLMGSSYAIEKINAQHSSYFNELFTQAGRTNITFDYKELLSLIIPSLGAMGNNSTIIICTAVIILVLSMMMILQGIANTRTGSEDDMPPKELGKFLFIFFIIAYIVSSVIFVYFLKYDQQEATIWLGIGFVLILVIAFLVKILFKKAKQNAKPDKEVPTIKKPPEKAEPSKNQ